VVVRENTEGLYAGIGGALRPGTEAEVAIDEEISTHLGVTRVLDYAFGIARREVCMVDKSNAVPNGGRLWQRCWRAAVDRHPDVPCRHLYVDTAAMKLVEDPSAFDVIVANNSYGDILSDLTAQLAGGLGTAASANINPLTGAGLYEPVHGSAPDIAGTGAANPIAAISSAALLIDHAGYNAEAAAVRKAITAAVAAGRCTPDLGGTLTTEQAAAAIRAELG
jgi:3-isopropylmalate dehydrogenase